MNTLLNSYFVKTHRLEISITIIAIVLFFFSPFVFSLPSSVSLFCLFISFLFWFTNKSKINRIIKRKRKERYVRTRTRRYRNDKTNER